GDGGADHTGGEFNNSGLVSSDSRAVNIDGNGLTVNNSGAILGTDNQRNGTIYADDTANNYTINNSGLIDTGEGNNGAAVSLSLGEEAVNATINNSGLIQGRAEDGEALAPTSPQAGDGIRLEGVRGTNAEGGVTFAPATFTGEVNNSGLISSGENVTGSTAGFHAVNGVSFHGRLNNTGTIEGTQNGVYFGNPVGDGGADHTGGEFNNSGLVSSDSRAVNIDGNGLTVNNSGAILGTDNQRNGTIYADDTANNYTINNSGLIDTGEGNNGAAVSLSLGEEAVNATINNSGLIQGRAEDGEALAPTSPQAGDGIRLEGVRGTNAEGGVTFAPATFTGEVNNSGLISSGENVTGSTAGFHAVNGVSFHGRLNNTGTIEGTQNGVYFGNPVGDGGADHTGGEFNNSGLVSSDSRAVNIDGNGLIVNNSGAILGTDNQRNGTVYFDGTTENATLNNSGLIDAGEGNSGSGVSVQVGSTGAFGDDLETSANINNSGLIQARGTEQNPSGVRFFVGSGLEEATFSGNVNNDGTISSEQEAGIKVEEGVIFNGQIVNNGTISGGNGLAIDATGARGQVNVENNANLDGSVVLGDGDDIFVQNSDEGVEITGGLGNDSITGGAGSDTVRFDDIDVGVNVDLSAGNAQRETGFEIAIAEQILVNPNDGIDPNTIVTEGIDGNLYFNFHASDFPGGELRGQLELFADNRDANGVGTVIFSSNLSGDQEVQDEPVITDAFGTATATFTVSEDGSVSYSTAVSISGLNQADLLPVNIGNGTLSPIHLHNAPAGANGPVVVDIFTDAGSDGLIAIEETDALIDIENVVGSNDADVIIGDESDNILEGLDGNDTLIGGAGIDRIDGGEGIDTVDFSSASEGVIIDLDVNSAGANGAPSQDGAILDAPPAAGGQALEEVDDVENVIGSDFNDAIFGNNEVNVLIGGAGNDTIHSFGGADILDGGEGTDLALFSAGGAVSVDLDDNGDAISSLGDTLTGFENINGSNAGNDTISGNSFSNVLNGQGGNDILNGEGGDDTLIGGAGNDIFVFELGSGLDTITDFNSGDILDFSAIFNDAGSVFGAATEIDSNTIFDLGDGNTVTLENVALDSLTTDNLFLA
ncbi:MAG: CHRD domain-containing protein, partial [Cyanobacteria bacterium J06623_7]